MTRDDNVIDLFAGPGGWDEGVRALGLRPVGVEWDTAACQTAVAAGHVRFQHDIAQLDPREFAGSVFEGPVRGLIASPPCQGFSQAGKQQGRKDAGTLLAAIPRMRTGEDVRPELRASMADPRSILVLEPLRWAVALTPSWMAWEQVPAVLPIWEACAEVLRALGYTVATGNLQSEQYGVPQTRKRAILVARAPWMSRRFGPAELPAPTHSRYYSRTPGKLDAGVLPWVSMAEALGWGMTARPYPSIAGGTGGGPDPLLVGGSHARGVVYGEHDAGRWVQQSNYSGPDVGEDGKRTLGEREVDEPSSTLTSKGFRWLRHNQGDRNRPKDEGGVARVRMEDGSDYYQRFPTDGPAPVITTQADAWKWDDAEQVETDENGARRYYVQGTQANATVRRDDQPAPTVLFGHAVNTVTWSDSRRRRKQGDGTAVRVSISEAAVLQSFPADYPWQGTKTAQYRQVGDAVPPRLALTVVGQVAAIEVERDEAAPWPFRKPAPTVIGAQQGVLTKPGQTHHAAQREVRAQEKGAPLQAAEPDDEGAA